MNFWELLDLDIIDSVGGGEKSAEPGAIQQVCPTGRAAGGCVACAVPSFTGTGRKQSAAGGGRTCGSAAGAMAFAVRASFAFDATVSSHNEERRGSTYCSMKPISTRAPV